MSKTISTILLFLTMLGLGFSDPLKVCVTVPDLGDLAKVIGQGQVEVTVFVKGQEDPHSLVAKPSDVVKLSKADAFILLGMGMEIGWAPALLSRARNNQLTTEKPGYIDASTVIKPIHDAPGSFITRAMGDVHPEGNPHYMLDPVNGLMVAKLISERFAEIKPSSKSFFHQNYLKFEAAWAEKAFGSNLLAKYPLDKLIQIQTVGKLGDFLQQTGETKLLKGWFGKMEPLKGEQLVADHSQWPYFASRFHLNIDRFLEPKPGVPPSAKYLKRLVDWMNTENIPGVLASTYFSPRDLAFVEKHCKAQILPSAHQVNARTGTNSYLSMIDHNVKLICDCCAKK